jgi:uncharacterized protein (UPF0262 family)
VVIDPASLAASSREVEHEREVAIADLLERNDFQPEGAGEGPFDLRLACVENRLALDITGPELRAPPHPSLSPPARTDQGLPADLRELLRGDARGLAHSRSKPWIWAAAGCTTKPAEILRERLAGKVETDLETARRLFTLICALRWRG